MFGGRGAGQTTAGLVAVGILNRLKADDPVCRHGYSPADGARLLIGGEEKLLPGVIGVLKRRQNQMLIEGEVHDLESLRALQRAAIENVVFAVAVNLTKRPSIGDRAIDDDEMLEGVEVGPSRRIGIVLPAAPDIENPSPMAVVEGDLVHALQVEPDRHPTGAVCGEVIGWFIACLLYTSDAADE